MDASQLSMSYDPSEDMEYGEPLRITLHAMHDDATPRSVVDAHLAAALRVALGAARPRGSTPQRPGMPGVPYGAQSPHRGSRAPYPSLGPGGAASGARPVPSREASWRAAPAPPRRCA